MADDIKITAGGDLKDADRALDKLDQKLDKVAASAQQTGQSFQQVGAATGQGAVDMEQVGQKSERASSQLLQLANSVRMLGQGRVDMHSLTILAKEATGSLGDLGDTLVKLGGGTAIAGKGLHALSGFLGPASVVIAGATALWTIWQAVNREVEKTPGKVDEAAKRLEAMREELARLRDSFAAGFGDEADKEQTQLINRMLRDSNKQGPLGEGFSPDKMGDAIGRVLLKRQGKSDLEPQNVIASQKEALQLLEKAAQGSVLSQERVLAIMREISADVSQRRATGAAVSPLAGQAADVFDETQRQVKAEKAFTDRTKKEKDQTDLTTKLREAAEKKIAKHDADVKAATDKAFDAFAKMVDHHGGDTAAALTRLREALTEDGKQADVIADVLKTVVTKLNSASRGLEGFGREGTAGKRGEPTPGAAPAASAAAGGARGGESAGKSQIAPEVQRTIDMLAEVGNDQSKVTQQLIENMMQVGVADRAAAERTAQDLVSRAVAAMQSADAEKPAERAPDKPDVPTPNKPTKTEQQIGNVRLDRIIQLLQRINGNQSRPGGPSGMTGANRPAPAGEPAGEPPPLTPREQRRDDMLKAKSDKAKRLGKEIDEVTLSPAEQREIARRAIARQKDEQRAIRQRPKELEKEEIEAGEEQRGRKLTRPERAEAVARARQRFAAEKSQFDSQRGRRQGPRGAGQQGGGGEGEGGNAAQELQQAAQGFGQGFPQTMQEVVAAVTQMATTLANMNTVNTGVRQAVRTARQQLPGPGASRR